MCVGGCLYPIAMTYYINWFHILSCPLHLGINWPWRLRPLYCWIQRITTWQGFLFLCPWGPLVLVNCSFLFLCLSPGFGCQGDWPQRMSWEVPFFFQSERCCPALGLFLSDSFIHRRPPVGPRLFLWWEDFFFFFFLLLNVTWFLWFERKSLGFPFILTSSFSNLCHSRIFPLS